jgi:hypothetical protein
MFINIYTLLDIDMLKLSDILNLFGYNVILFNLFIPLWVHYAI